MMQKKYSYILFLIIFFLFFLVTNSLSQQTRWVMIAEKETGKIYLDTTSIKVFDEQLSIWSQEILNNLEKIGPNEAEVSKIKTHYLFDLIEERFTVIGKLYYNPDGRIVGQSSNQRITGATKTFMLPVKSHAEVELIFNKAVEFNKTKSVTSSGKIALNNELNAPIISQTETLDNSKTPIVTEGTGQKKIDAQKGMRVAFIFDPITNQTIELIEVIDKVEEKEIINRVEKIRKKAPFESDNYDFANESMITNTIFSDGSLYCFQISSWKTKSIADNELRKLKRKGYNAFIVSAKPKHKRGTWHRVRIGYFDNLEETKTFQKKIK